MFKDIPKFVINLDRKKDRLDLFDKEMEYIGWEYERFSAIDTNSYVGCGLSFINLCELAIERNYEHIMIFEDDIYFMPYAKDVIPELETEIFEKITDWKIFHFGPTLHRPVNHSKKSKNLLDLTNLPIKKNNHTEIYGTSGFVFKKEIFEPIIKWNTNKYIENSHMHKPIDVYINKVLYPIFQSYTYKLPVVVQRNYYSDINKTFDKNHYLMTYNWNIYCPDKLPFKYLDQDYCTSLKKI